MSSFFKKLSKAIGPATQSYLAAAKDKNAQDLQAAQFGLQQQKTEADLINQLAEQAARQQALGLQKAAGEREAQKFKWDEAMQPVDRAYKEAQTKKLVAEAAKDRTAASASKTASPLGKLGSEEKKTVGMIGDAFRSLQAYQDQFDQGARRSRVNPDTALIGSFVSSTPIDQATAKLKDDIGRLRSGGAIGKEEEASFLKMLPTAADTDQAALMKLKSLDTEFQNRLAPFGITKDSLKSAGFNLSDERAKNAGGGFPRQIRKGGSVATVSSAQELAEAQAEGWN